MPRTLLDLASVLSPERLLDAINEAEQRGLGDPLSLPALIERHRGERGVAILREVLADAGYGVTDRELEERFARFVARIAAPSRTSRPADPSCRGRGSPDRRLDSTLQSTRLSSWPRAGA